MIPSSLHSSETDVSRWATGTSTSSAATPSRFQRPSRAENSGLCATPIPNRTFATPYVSRPFLSHARSKLSAENRRDLLKITEDRYGIRSTVITSQLPVENWHDIVGDPTLADAILDRLVHSAYQLNLKGESMRKRRQPLTQTDHRDS